MINYVRQLVFRIGVLCFCISHPLEGKENRLVIATLDGIPVYFDQIRSDKSVSEKNDISFTDHVMLYRFLKNGYLAALIERHQITPSKDVLTAKAQGLAQNYWKLIGKTDEERENQLSLGKDRASIIYEALLEYKKDGTKGDSLWERDLKSLGIPKEYWKKIISPGEYEKNLENLKTFLEISAHQYVISEHLEQGEFAAKIELLQQVLVPDIEVSPQEINNLYTLINKAKSLEFDVLYGPKSDLELIKNAKNFTDNAAMKQLSKQSISFDNKSLSLDLDNENRIYAFLLANYFSNLFDGNLSDLFMWKFGNKWQNCMIRINRLDWESEEDNVDVKTYQSLKHQLLKFKRSCAFDLMIDREMLNSCEIVHNDFKAFFDSIFP